ncbi:MAG: hypothetical protein CUN54_08230, partial [Phototrophicales bacterium]
LKPGELPADVFLDLQTDNNKLSVWHLENENSEHFERLIAALAANQDYPSYIDYALIEAQMLKQIDIRYEQTPGDTADDEVNTWHYDLVELTAAKLFQLVNAIHASNSNRDDVRVAPRDVKKWLIKHSGNLDPDRIKIKKTKLRRQMGLSKIDDTS